MEEKENIIIKGAKVNNLKNINLEIPRNKFIVITGISGSGKSSLAFDTLFAEGQRRFAESLSSYARQFLGRMTKPDVELITGIPPAIAIEQKVNTRNPRSTVATITEIYDYLKLIFARIGHTYSPISGVEVKCNTVNDVMNYISSLNEDTAVYLLADIDWKNREDKIEFLLSLKESGYSRLFGGDDNIENGHIYRIDDILASFNKTDFPTNLYLLVDRVKMPGKGEVSIETNENDFNTRLRSSIDNCFNEGKGTMYVVNTDPLTCKKFINRFEADGLTFHKPDEYMFSFNSPLGACPVCGGLGKVIGISEDLVVPDKSKSIYDGAIACWRGEKMGRFRERLIEVSDKYNIPVFTPYCELDEKIKDLIWNTSSNDGNPDSFVGINEFFKWVESNKYKVQYRYMLSRFSGKTVCHECKGSRLRKDALYVKVGGKNINELLQMTVSELLIFLSKLELPGNEKLIVEKPLEEIISRLKYISDVGLSYLTLSRTCNTLSGGETQRINLVTALGSSLVGSMYILDEPSIGLHPRDTDRLIGVLKRLRDIGNTVIVVEHDEEIIKAADYLIDIGPYAGINGGEIMFEGSLNKNISANDIEKSLTLQYVLGKKSLMERHKNEWKYSIKIEGAMEHNLKNIDVKFPLGVLTVVSGVSGSGKSSLVGDLLYPALFRKLNDTGNLPGIFRKLSGDIDKIGQIEYVDQNPIGRSSRSNAVTYLKIYDDIRELFSSQPYAKINGYTPSYFSFNQDGGRCSECQGEGYVHISMQFMSDVTMVCEACGGKRFKPDILEVKYAGKNIDDILNMSVSEAIDFFAAQKEPIASSIVTKLQYLADVGLSYIKLGQGSSTLSGGESQRIKLAYFLSKNDMEVSGKKKHMMFIFDEPTTGLHSYDVEKLLKAFDFLIAKGHTIIVVEHNPYVIMNADWIIDLGPDAGDKGGKVVFEGTPEDMVKNSNGFTAEYMRKLCR